MFVILSLFCTLAKSDIAHYCHAMSHARTNKTDAIKGEKDE